MGMLSLQHTKIVRLLLILMVAGFLTGCQEEFIEITEPNADTAFASSDSIAGLILKVTLKDGSFDNMIDKCSEINIEFPYSVRVRNEIIEIQSPEEIEALHEQLKQNSKSIKIVFPVTVSFSDYSTMVVSNNGELMRLQNRYIHRKYDDDIECIDFIYPIEMDLYDTLFQKQEYRHVRNDKAFHGILKGKKDFIFEIEYPVSLEISDSTTIEVTNNSELKHAIRNSIGTCDENDEVELENEDQHPGE